MSKSKIKVNHKNILADISKLNDIINKIQNVDIKGKNASKKIKRIGEEAKIFTNSVNSKYSPLEKIYNELGITNSNNWCGFTFWNTFYR